MRGQVASLGTGLATIPEAIAAIGRGETVIVVDDADREDEGDLVVAAEHATPEAVNFMVRFGRGLVCLPLAAERCDELELGPMAPDRAGHEETAFTVSIDLEVPGSTGISAHDRARTIRRAVAPDAVAGEFRRPGHVFPLRARDGGVLERPGHTEAAVDLARLAGCSPAGVVCEIMNADGTMARLPDLLAFAQTHDLLLVTVADLVAYRRRHEPLVERAATAAVPTTSGTFTTIAYSDRLGGTEHVALTFGDLDAASGEAPLVRVHSECLTGDVFGSLRCDCGEQLDAALAAIAAEGRGVVVYVRGHEGRGIGLIDKLRAYVLQDAGHDTVEANVELGHVGDRRDYDAAAHVLRDLGLTDVRLLTNNPRKREGLERQGITVSGLVPIEVVPGPHNLRYLETKRDKMGHVLAARAETA